MSRLLCICAGLALAGCTGTSSDGSNGTVRPPVSDTGGFGSTGGSGGPGSGSVHSDDGFGFSPLSVRVTDLERVTTVRRAVVTLSADAADGCAQFTGQRVTLSFGDESTLLVAGSYLVDGGATITWDPGTTGTSGTLTATQGLINCNSVYQGEVAGSFSADLGLDDGGTSVLTGIFTAAGCN